MRRNLPASVVVLTLALNLAIAAHGFQGQQGGPGFTGSPGGGFTGPRGSGFTDSLGGMRGADNEGGLNIMEFLRMRRNGRANLSGNVNPSNNANSRKPVNPVNKADRTNALKPANVNREGVEWNNPHMRFHRGWVLGYWTGRYADGLGWRPVGYPDPGFQGVGVGGGPRYGRITGLGWGLTPWVYGPMLYQYRYSRYHNPYHDEAAVTGKPIDAYDYSQPLDAQSTLPPKLATDQAVSTFKSARQGFARGDYEAALILVDNALKLMPNDPAMHEFRALTLFALGRCDEAAMALYGVLSIEPGWDWPTLISLYGDPARYTQQLRALEAYSATHPRSAQAHFVLAYQYLTQEFAAAAIEQFKIAVNLEPRDILSAQLIQLLAQAPHQLATVAASTRKDERIEASWIARPSNDAAIRLTIQEGGRFLWNVEGQGKDRQFQGKSTESNGTLIFVQDQTNDTMAGSVQWTDPAHFVFRVMGAAQGDPGLSFMKNLED